ncbi:uncharacterized protein [Prorops nasuta]|uniref:uncharacterized protein n=1 Tax=Prorops nasuta TaxID=863751 RepID=UPI0034CEFA90
MQVLSNCAAQEVEDNDHTRAADRELQLMFKRSSDFYTNVAKDLAGQGVEWHFIPPHSPHFGGLWEAGVKATKHHLVRVIGEYALTFEEFATLLAEIEACLNSRPLCPLTGDMEDYLIPDAPIGDIPDNRLNRYQLLSKIQQTFWRRWSKEYLHHLQERSKWRGANENYAVGQLVIVQDDRYPPSKWPLGRIIDVHPGDDGLVRVATVKTESTILKRPIVRLSPLPMNDNESSK